MVLSASRPRIDGVVRRRLDAASAPVVVVVLLVVVVVLVVRLVVLVVLGLGLAVVSRRRGRRVGRGGRGAAARRERGVDGGVDVRVPDGRGHAQVEEAQRLQRRLAAFLARGLRAAYLASAAAAAAASVAGRARRERRRERAAGVARRGPAVHEVGHHQLDARHHDEVRAPRVRVVERRAQERQRAPSRAARSAPASASPR